MAPRNSLLHNSYCMQFDFLSLKRVVTCGNNKNPKVKRLRLTGPEKAAYRRRRQQIAKRAVSRRVAMWRSRMVDGEQEVVYVTLGGDVLKKGGRHLGCYNSNMRQSVGSPAGLSERLLQIKST
eukprot:g19725.t1